jgi:hypothetical protein
MKQSTAQKGDISEFSVALECLKRGWEILYPNGNRKPYDFVVEENGKFARIQIKSGWYDEKTDAFYAKRVKTLANRKKVKITNYSIDDFDFAICYIVELNEFYIIPSINFINDLRGNQISLRKLNESQRECFGSKYKNNWNLLEEFLNIAGGR